MKIIEKTRKALIKTITTCFFSFAFLFGISLITGVISFLNYLTFILLKKMIFGEIEIDFEGIIIAIVGVIFSIFMDCITLYGIQKTFTSISKEEFEKRNNHLHILSSIAQNYLKTYHPEKCTQIYKCSLGERRLVAENDDEIILDFWKIIKMALMTRKSVSLYFYQIIGACFSTKVVMTRPVSGHEALQILKTNKRNQLHFICYDFSIQT